MHALNANWINTVKKNTFSSTVDVMNLITIQMMIVMRLIQMKNGRIIKIIMKKVRFLMVVGNISAKQVVKFVMARLTSRNAQLVWTDFHWIQQLSNAWDVTINVWLAFQIILEIAHHAILDGLSTDLMFQECLHVQNVPLSTAGNAIQLITVRNAKTFTSVNQKLPVNLAFLIVEFAITFHLVSNVTAGTFWLKWTALNLAFYVQVDVHPAQALLIV